MQTDSNPVASWAAYLGAPSETPAARREAARAARLGAMTAAQRAATERLSAAYSEWLRAELEAADDLDSETGCEAES